MVVKWDMTVSLVLVVCQGWMQIVKTHGRLGRNGTEAGVKCGVVE